MDENSCKAKDMQDKPTLNEASQKAVVLDSPSLSDISETNKIAPSRKTLNRSESASSILLSSSITRMKKFTRRVSFPEDDKLISGYGEPKNPWANVHGATTEDLIQTYTEACQQWGVKPINKLLVQLQEISDFSVRAESLTLKGEKLDSRVVETLEAVFKRVQFVTMDLEATNLDEDAAASLFDMIEYYESAVNVLIGFNKSLGTRGWQAAAHMMRKMSCLRLFDGHNIPMSIQAAPFVGRALRLSNTLVTLHLENAILSGRPMLLIIAALRMNKALRELFLADNRLSPLDALQLANLLKFNRTIELLDLRNNIITDFGLGHLCAGLMAQSTPAPGSVTIEGVKTLVLWNNQISHEGMMKLSLALKYTPSLATLNLGQNVIGNDGLLKLKEGLLQNQSLLRLGLVGTKLTCEGAVAVAEYLAESPRIIRLDLRNNDIKVGGLMALSLAYKINHSLLRLDIDKPNKKDTMKELVSKQEVLLLDMVNYSQRNKAYALERAQALLMQQKNNESQILRSAEPVAQQTVEKAVQNGLRYMDITNASYVPKNIPNSFNNSNNSKQQSVNTKTYTAFTAASKKASAETPSSSKLISTDIIPSEVDDSPENSPEFLPRNSVSYHHVTPVMLSSSEMQKRSQNPLPTVEEHDPESTSMEETTIPQQDEAEDEQHETTSHEKYINKANLSDENDPQDGVSQLCETENNVVESFVHQPSHDDSVIDSQKASVSEEPKDVLSKGDADENQSSNPLSKEATTHEDDVVDTETFLHEPSTHKHDDSNEDVDTKS